MQSSNDGQYTYFRPEEHKQGFRLYGSSERVKSAGDSFASIAAVISILTPLICLHFVPAANARLAVIVIFSLCFVIFLRALTDAKRSEVFAATAAFVAVQAVYVGNNSGKSS